MGLCHKKFRMVFVSGQLTIAVFALGLLSHTTSAFAGRTWNAFGERLFGFEVYCPKEESLRRRSSNMEACVSEQPQPAKDPAVTSMFDRGVAVLQKMETTYNDTMGKIPGLRRFAGVSYDGQKISDEERHKQIQFEWAWLNKANEARERALKLNRVALAQVLQDTRAPKCPSLGCDTKKMARGKVLQYLKTQADLEAETNRLEQNSCYEPCSLKNNIESAVAKCRDSCTKSREQRIEKLKALRDTILAASPIVAHPKFEDLDSCATSIAYGADQMFNSNSGYDGRFNKCLDSKFDTLFDAANTDVLESVDRRLNQIGQIKKLNQSPVNATTDEEKEDILNDTELIQECLALNGSKIELEKPELIAAACRLDNRTLKDRAMAELKGLYVNSFLAIASLGVGTLGTAVKGLSAAARVARVGSFVAVEGVGLNESRLAMNETARRCDFLASSLATASTSSSELVSKINQYHECEKELDSLTTMAWVGGAGVAVGAFGTVANEVALTRKAAALSKESELTLVAGGLKNEISTERSLAAGADATAESKAFDSFVEHPKLAKMSSEMRSPQLQQKIDDIALSLTGSSDKVRSKLMRVLDKMSDREINDFFEKMAKKCVGGK